jgi:CubicO group peptidase (beta-lactamase class C family)
MHVTRVTLLALVSLWLQHPVGSQERFVVRNGTVAGEVGARLDQHVSRIDNFSGAILVVRHDRVLLGKGYGLADRTRKIPFTTDTVFDVGSITKQFTGAAIAKLASQGKLSFDDRLTKYFDNVPADKQTITIQHLLTHMAGLPGALGKDYEAIDRERYLKLAFDAKLHDRPGGSHRYSNVGYSILGAIVEKVTGHTYERYLHEQLFKPAGMLRTGYVMPTWSPGALAIGYRKGEAWGTPRDHPWAEDGPYWHLRANGGILSTVEDLYRWHVALRDSTVLPADVRKKYQAPQVPEEPGGSIFYAFGWTVRETPHGTLIAHNGGNDVFFADFHRYVDAETVLILGTNASDRSVFELLDKLATVVFEREQRGMGDRDY